MTPKEEEILKKAVSDGAFHYHGSAKIMCGIGKGFAEAMIELEKEKIDEGFGGKEPRSRRSCTGGEGS